MGIETKTTTIGGHTYKLTTFGARKGMQVAMILARFLGPALAEALGSNKEVRQAAKAVQAGLSGSVPVDGPKAAAAVQEAANAVQEASAAVQDTTREADEALGSILVRGIKTFAATADPKDFDSLVEAFVEQCVLVQPLTLKGDKEGSTDIKLTLKVFDAHFAGRYRDLIQWLIWCVSVNFADFFGESGNA